MALRHCDDCSKHISMSARQCPHCGWVTRWGVFENMIGVPILTIIVAFYFFFDGR